MDSRKLETLRTLLEQNARSLVDTPAAVAVTCKLSEESITFTVKTIEREVGQLVGRNGRIGNALRILIKSATKKEVKKAIYLSIETV